LTTNLAINFTFIAFLYLVLFFIPNLVLFTIIAPVLHLLLSAYRIGSGLGAAEMERL